MSNLPPAPLIARLGSPRSRAPGLPARPPVDWGRGQDAPHAEPEDGEEVERRRPLPSRRDDSPPPRGGGETRRRGRESDRYAGSGGRRQDRRRSRSRSRSRSRTPPRNRGGGGAYRDPGRGSRDSYRPPQQQSYRARSRSPYRRSPSLTPPPRARPALIPSRSPSPPPKRRRGSTPPRPRRDPPPHVDPAPPPASASASASASAQRQGSTPPRPHSPPPPPRVNNWGMNPQREFARPRAETKYAAPASTQFAPPTGPSQNRWAAAVPPASSTRPDAPTRHDPPAALFQNEWDEPPPRDPPRPSSPPKRIVPLASLPDPTIPTGPRSHFPAAPPRRRPGPIAPPSPPAPAVIPTGPRGWRAPPPGEDSAERERKRDEAAKDEHDKLEAKRRAVLLQRWLPKGMIKLAAVDPATDTEIHKVRTIRLSTLRPAHYEKALAMRSAQTHLEMAKAERDVARDRVKASLVGIAGAGGVPMTAALSAGA